MGPEQESSIRFTETLNDETRDRINQELQANDRLVKLLLWMRPEEESNPDRLSWVAGLVDSQSGRGVGEKIFDAKLDMVKFINKEITVTSGGPAAVKEKNGNINRQWRNCSLRLAGCSHKRNIEYWKRF